MIRVTVLIILLLDLRSQAFQWDTNNVERVFGRTIEILDELIPLTPEEDQQECLIEFGGFVANLMSGQDSSLKILDSWGVAPSGLFSGNVYNFGHFDQCINLAQTQHCQLQIVNEIKSYTMGICVPQICADDTIIELFSRLMQGADTEIVEQQQNLQCTIKDKPKFEALQWVTVSILCLIAAFVVSSTLYDVAKAYRSEKASELLSSFSIFRNLETLFQIRHTPAPLDCLNGIRVLSMFWIILYYAFYQYKHVVAIYNPIAFEEFQKTAGRTYVSHADLAADTFFLVAGVLMTYNVLKSLEVNYTFNVLKFWVHRYLRLLPVFGIVILLLTSFTLNVGRGPAYQLGTESMLANCKEYWWTSILFVQNYVNPLNLCIEPTWYLSVDFQFYLIAPFIIFPLRRFGFRFIPVMCFLNLASLGYIFGFSIAKRFHFNNTPDDYMKFIYYASHTRVSQWLVGIILGFLLYKKESKISNIHKAITGFLWIFSLAIMLTIVFIPLPAYENGSEDVIAFAFYEALHRFMWSLAMSWVIYASFRGLGAPVNWILSFPIFQPLAKLSYAVFILQYPLMVITMSLQRTPEYFSEYLAFNLFINILGMSLLFALPLVLFIEMPVRNIESALYATYDDIVVRDSYFERDVPQQRSIFRMPRLRVEKKTAF